MLPPSLEADYAVVRALPLFEGIPDDDLVHTMTQGGIALRSLERDMFVLDPIGLAGGQAAPVVYVARGQVAAAVFTETDLQERRAQQIAHENATKEEREAESLIKPAPLARIALKNVALFMEGDLFNSGALQATHGQPIAFYTTAPSALSANSPTAAGSATGPKAATTTACSSARLSTNNLRPSATAR